MIKKISAVKVRQNLGEIMNEVSLRNDQYIIERSGKPLVATVPVRQLEKWLEHREAFFQRIEEIQDGREEASAGEWEETVEAAVQAVRDKERKGRTKRSPKKK